MKVKREKKMEAKLTFQFRADNGLIARLDSWRRSQPDLPSRAEAVRRIVDTALGKQKPKKPE